MDHHRLTKHIFQSDTLFSVTGKRNWSYDVNSIIQHLRLPKNIFENFVACDISNVKHETFFLLMDEERKRDIVYKPKLRKYITLKENLLYQITFPLYYLIEVFFQQFCCGILLLRVETGHRQRVRDETTGQTRSLRLYERVCSICSSGQVEDEYHFLLKCNVFSDIRVDYINNIMPNNADFINFNLKQKNTFLIIKFWRETLIVLCKAWSKRKTCLYR